MMGETIKNTGHMGISLTDACRKISNHNRAPPHLLGQIGDVIDYHVALLLVRQDPDVICESLDVAKGCTGHQ